MSDVDGGRDAGLGRWAEGMKEPVMMKAEARVARKGVRARSFMLGYFRGGRGG